MEKKVIARKKYKCNCCGNEIKKRDKYQFGKARIPKYDENEEQIGIEYVQWRYCLDCIIEKVNPEECEHDNIATHYDYIPGEAVKEPQHDYCIDCGKKF